MNQQQVVLTAVAGVMVAYLLGSVPFGLLLGLARGVDIRTQGSKNIGATNAGRVLGMHYFWYAFILDFLKGLLPVLSCDLLVLRWSGPAWIPLATAAAAVFGHLCPIFLRFKGGKGVATGFGAILGIWPVFTVCGLGAAAVFVLVFMATRVISLSSLVGAVSFTLLVPIAGHFLAPIPGVIYPEPWNKLMTLLAASWLFCLIIIWKHRSNIGRLLAGTEPKWGEQSKAPQQ
jgi:acyl phosphate:glycerol-3-phosphate acyltransferase